MKLRLLARYAACPSAYECAPVDPNVLSPQLNRERGFDIYNEVDSRKCWLEQYKQVKHNGIVRIQCGEWHSKLTESDQMIDATLDLLERGVKIYIISGNDSRDYKIAIKKFKENHPRWSELIRDYPDQLFFYRLNRRPNRHYTIFNNSTGYIEQKHIHGRKKETLFRRDSKFAAGLTALFTRNLGLVEPFRLRSSES